MNTDKKGLVIKALEIRHKPFHVSENFRIIYVLKGSLCLEFVAGRYYLTEGNFEIINIDEPVKLFGETEKDNIILMFEIERETAKSLQPLIDKALYNCNTTLFYPSKAKKKHKQQLITKLLLMYNLYINSQEQGAADDALIIKTARETEELVVENFHDFKNMLIDSEVSDARLNRFLRIYDSIYMDSASKLNLKKLADNEYVSVQYLSKEFNEKLNINFKATVEYYKVIQAVRYLITTNMPVTLISENSGFSAPRYFYKQFSTYLKCTPVAFRDKLKDEEEQVLELPPYDDEVKSLIKKEAAFNLGVFEKADFEKADEEENAEECCGEAHGKAVNGEAENAEVLRDGGCVTGGGLKSFGEGVKTENRGQSLAENRINELISEVRKARGTREEAVKLALLSEEEIKRAENLLGEELLKTTAAVSVKSLGKSPGQLAYDIEDALNFISLMINTAASKEIKFDFRWDISILSEKLDSILGYEPTDVIVGLLQITFR